MVHIELVTPSWMAALSKSDAEFTAQFGIPVVTDWAGFPETVPMLVAAARKGPEHQWGPHLVFDDDGALVGNGGWKSDPVDGAAELGYAVAPARQNRGIATAVVRELVASARDAGLRRVIAHTTAAESASPAVLRKCGFTRVAEIVDPDDGRVWRWELDLR